MSPCPQCGEREMVLCDARSERFHCDICKHAWRTNTGPSYDDRRTTDRERRTDVSGHLIDGE